MRQGAISAVLLGVAHVTFAAGPAAAAPAAPATAVPAAIADGGTGVTLARAGASSFLAAPRAETAEIVPVGEGGRGRGRWRDGYYAYPGWGPPPGYYYAPPPPPRYYRPPPVYYAPPPPVYYAPPPPAYYVPAPGVSLNFRF